MACPVPIRTSTTKSVFMLQVPVVNDSRLFKQAEEETQLIAAVYLEVKH